MKLFYDKPFATIENEIWISIENRLKGSYKTLKTDMVVTNLIAQHPINIPELGDSKDIKSTVYLEDKNGRVYQPNPNAEYSINGVTAVATFHIPFSGPKDFFSVIPTNRVEVGSNVNVLDNILIIKIPTQYVRLELTEQWTDYIRTTISYIKNNIEENLENLRADRDNFIKGLDNKIREHIKQKQSEISAEEKRNNEINPFI